MSPLSDTMDGMPLEAPSPAVDDLDDEQREAVLAARGPVCVLAGAGTGKTRTITRRIAHLVAGGHVAPSQVLAVTFTARAAGEMRTRLRLLGQQSGVNTSAVQAVTFDPPVSMDPCNESGKVNPPVWTSKPVTNDQIVAGCEAAIRAGAAFVKTGTGWAPTGATLENTRLILDTVRGRCKVKTLCCHRGSEKMQRPRP